MVLDWCSTRSTWRLAFDSSHRGQLYIDCVPSDACTVLEIPNTQYSARSSQELPERVEHPRADSLGTTFSARAGCTIRSSAECDSYNTQGVGSYTRESAQQYSTHRRDAFEDLNQQEIAAHTHSESTR